MRHASRKFIVAMYFGTGCMLLCGMHCMGGSECVAAITCLAGLYKYFNVKDSALDNGAGGR